MSNVKNPLSRRVSKDIQMPSSYSLLSQIGSTNTKISNFEPPNRNYRVNSINLRSRSHSTRKNQKITNIQLRDNSNKIKNKFKKKVI